MPYPKMKVSCPNCGEYSVVDVTIQDDMAIATSMMHAVGIKVYDFEGDKPCPYCGRGITVHISVFSTPKIEWRNNEENIIQSTCS